MKGIIEHLGYGTVTSVTTAYNTGDHGGGIRYKRGNKALRDSLQSYKAGHGWDVLPRNYAEYAEVG